MPNMQELKTDLREFIKTDQTLQTYLRENKKQGLRRFWNLFRSDIMRKRPSQLIEYLDKIDQNTRLADISGGSKFGLGLKEKLLQFVSAPNQNEDLRLCQIALIEACLEMDAALKLDAASYDKTNPQFKEMIKERLDLWPLPH